MVKQSTKLDKALSALADPTRRDILERLLRHTHSVTEIAGPYEMSLPAVSKHLRVLEEADLIKRKKQGREYYFLPNPEPLNDIKKKLEHYEKFWTKNLENLEKYLTKENKK